ncbi:MAG: hypothetical protein EP330_07865 [Deltaproteobacteria bacterium]|nr:MAG: hypothetical protein EP330_07865 [Deltaproteobacteria bacterium]
MSLVHRAWRAYRQRRVVHINVNIVLAGVASMALTTGVLHLSRGWVSSPWAIAVGTALTDALFDIALFATLHWLASRAGWEQQRDTHGSLAGDTARLQFHRFVLAPIFYIGSVTSHGLLMSAGVDRVAAAWLAYMGTLAFTRLMHTTYGLRVGLFEDAPG